MLTDLLQMRLDLPRKVFAGDGCLMQIGKLAAEHEAKKVILVTDPVLLQKGFIDDVRNSLEEYKISIDCLITVESEPTVRKLDEPAAGTDTENCGLVIGIGGGSVLDTAKLISALGGNPGLAGKWHESGRITRPSIPWIAVPTTAGTGAEATPNAILLDEGSHTKFAVVSPGMIPETVLLDCRLTSGLPAHVAAATGFDALAHALESITSKKANTFTDIFAIEAIRLILNNIENACCKNIPEARQNMLLASFYAGICLTTSTTHAVHAMAYPLSGHFHVPHGAGVAILLLPVLKYIKNGCGDRLARIAVLCLADGGGRMDDGDLTEKLIKYIEMLSQKLPLPVSLAKWGIDPGLFPEFAGEAIAIKRLFDNCPVGLGLHDLVNIYGNIK